MSLHKLSPLIDHTIRSLSPTACRRKLAEVNSGGGVRDNDG
jgi:hypothetical protein